MDKKIKIYLSIFALLIIGLIYIEMVKPKPLNWFPSYVSKHKTPYGTYVLYKELKALFPNTKVDNIKTAPYIYLKDNTRTGTYVFIDGQLNFGDEELDALLNFIKRGNDVFISTHGINIDTLNLKTKHIFSTEIDEIPFFKLINRNLSNKEFGFDRSFKNTVFSKIDTASTIVLGKTGYYTAENEERIVEGINFIKQPYGKGNLYLHTFPEAFTNYYILKSSNHQHTASILSYLDESKPILWDTYYKTGKSTISSPMHYLLNSKSLKWAYYMALIGLLFFIIFEGKRKQRHIPVIKPLKNQTLAFTRTISNMYYEKSKHKNIAEHKISYLLEYIRTKLHVPTVRINDNFYNYVASRSGLPKENIIALFAYIDQVHLKNEITQEELIELNKRIEEFKNPI